MGFIDKTGNFIIRSDPSEEYAYRTSFHDGLALVEKNGQYGYIDKNGDLTIPFGSYKDASNFSEGLARVEITKDKYGFIDKAGTLVISLESGWAYSFSNGLARAYRDGKLGFIDKKGNVVIPFEFSAATDFNEGLALAEKDGQLTILEIVS